MQSEQLSEEYSVHCCCLHVWVGLLDTRACGAREGDKSKQEREGFVCYRLLVITRWVMEALLAIPFSCLLRTPGRFWRCLVYT